MHLDVCERVLQKQGPEINGDGCLQILNGDYKIPEGRSSAVNGLICDLLQVGLGTLLPKGICLMHHDAKVLQCRLRGHSP